MGKNIMIKNKNKKMKTLIVYYSRTGTTKKVGEKLAKHLKCDHEEIIDLKSRAGPIGWMGAGKDAMKKKLTYIKDIKKDPKKYDLIIIGSPVWAGNVVPAIRTYILTNKPDIKKVAFFCTMGGSTGKIFSEMEEIINIKPLGTLSLKTKEVNNPDHDFNNKINVFVKGVKKIK
jgi:flavodoxin